MPRKLEDLTNKDFNNWKVLGRGENRRDGVARWICECQCKDKTISLVTTQDLKNNSSTQCRRCRGKHGKQLYGKKSKSWKGVGDIPARFYHNLKDGAKRRHLELSISLEDIWALFLKQDRKCALSGVDIFFGTKAGKLKDGNASLDRIDSTKGYTLDNIQFLHKKVNLMKSNLSDKEFINWCKKIGEKN